MSVFTRLITVRLTTLVLHNLTKKLTAHLRHYLCAVLPKVSDENAETDLYL